MFFNSFCLICETSIQAAKPLCSGCLNDIRRLYHHADQFCPQCAQWNGTGKICPDCQNNPPPYQKLWACADYLAPLPALLHEWKHSRQGEFAAIFQTILQENPPPWLAEAQIDAVLAMPISRKRRFMRGFNQCDDLTEVITKNYKIPTLPTDTILRQHKTPQSTLNAAERAENIINAFSVQQSVKNRKILIIDDVTSTSATLQELARTLQQSGAAEIYACVVMRNL